MNRQPYCRPPKWWEPKISPWWVRMSAPVRRRQLLSKQRITGVEADNLEVLRRELGQGRGVLIVANHSAHYDSAALYLAADQIHLPLYFMTAWQVFAMSSRFECWAMQRLGCFSVDRESTDRQAFKQAVQILQDAPYPLVIFPEGDIYHTSDCVTPFREGAAAVALAAAKRGARRQVVVPCGIKFWYAEDPTHDLLGIAATLEQRLYLRTQPQQTLPTRIHRLAEAALALKELDYLGHTREGRLRERVVFLTNAVLEQLEQRHAVRAAAPATVIGGFITGRAVGGIAVRADRENRENRENRVPQSIKRVQQGGGDRRTAGRHGRPVFCHAIVQLSGRLSGGQPQHRTTSGNAGQV